MCGIGGILVRESRCDQLESLANCMQTALRHRGPDGEGLYVALDRNAALIHTRLAILDLSSAGKQPMATPDGRYWIAFNGEIYNFRHLRSQLERDGETFHSQTDTEVILKLYQRKGAECVHDLRGMFAFAIWDEQEKTCFFARDPLGVKPLYYWSNGSMLVFASEVRAILATGLVSKNLSAVGLYGYLVNGSVPETQTLIEDIQGLAAGHSLTWKAGRLNQAQYWQIRMPEAAIALEDAQVKVRLALLDSVDHHFVSDVPVGLFLSGGIDSTTLLALASQHHGNLHTYSIAFEETAWNEGEIAHQAADHFGAKHTEHKVTAAMGRELLPQFLNAIDQPSVDGFNTFCVSKITQEHGTKVVLSGLGGDEIFGGYGSFQTVPQMVQLGNRLQEFQPLNRYLGMGLEQWSNSSRLRRIGDFLQQPPTPASAHRCFRGIFSHREACALVKQYLPDRPCLPRQGITHDSQFPSIQDEISFLELSGYMRNQLLRDSDVMSMRWGLELRVPMVDQVFWEAIATIPAPLRLAAGKQLLIQSMPELPEWIVNRPKRGFSFPFERWFAHEWSDYVSDLQCPKSILLKPWYRRWSLMVLQHWLQQQVYK